MLWQIQFRAGALGYMEVGTGKLFAVDGTPVTIPVDYSTIDTAPVQPPWYTEPQPPVDPVVEPPAKIHRISYKNRFTSAERMRILNASKTNLEVADALDIMAASDYIDLHAQATQADCILFESLGLLDAAGRALTILTTPPTPEEIYV